MNKNYSITLIALGAALIVALSPFQIALGSIPITLQTLVIGLIATLYRPKEATLSVLLYLLFRSNWSTSFLWWQWWSSRLYWTNWWNFTFLPTKSISHITDRKS